MPNASQFKVAMARLVLCVLAISACVGVAHAAAVPNDDEKGELPANLGKFFQIFNHINEPAAPEILQDAIKYGSIESHLDKFENATAAKTYHVMLKEGWFLPRGHPFSIDEPAHAFEIMTLFNALSSAKDFETIYGTAAYLRDKINEGIFIYAFSAASIYSKRVIPGIGLGPIFEIFPNYFHNAQIMGIIQKISAHGTKYVGFYPEFTTLDGQNIFIFANATNWPYVNDKNYALSYFTNDIGLNAALYMRSVVLPYWLSLEQTTETKMMEVRGSIIWLTYRQIVARYYMERLANGLGEIPDITDVIEEGYNPGLLHYNGVPFPSRPDNYRLDQPQLAGALEKVLEFEKRIWEAIDQGFYVDRKGEHVSLLNEEGINVLGNLIESNADSPNRYYYKDFIRLWKQILGNTVKSNYEYENHFTPLTVPSVLEKHETSLRDPAFYMLWNRILKFFAYWQKQMPLYKPEELSYPGVEIEDIKTDRLVTFFEPVLVNVSQALYRTSEVQGHPTYVQYEQLSHKPFSINIKVKSDADKNVLVKLFLAPKYDSKGLEIPLHVNTDNFYMLEYFPYELPAGESEITRKFDVRASRKIGDYKLNWEISSFPENLFLPKGNAGGQVLQLVAYIADNVEVSKRNILFPTDRPLHSYQLVNIKNIKFEDIKVYHQE